MPGNGGAMTVCCCPNAVFSCPLCPIDQIIPVFFTTHANMPTPAVHPEKMINESKWLEYKVPADWFGLSTGP